MRQYYFIKGNEKLGPFTLEELKAKQLSNDTLFWYEGQDGWKKANDVEELRTAFPPPIPGFNNIPPPPIHHPFPSETKKSLSGLKVVFTKNPSCF